MSDFKSIDPNSYFGQRMKKFEGIDSSKMVVPTPSFDFAMPDLPEIEPIPFAEHMEKTEEYQAKSLEMLQSINTNTANLYTLVELINKSNETQEVMLNTITEILAIAKARDKKEADSLFKKAMTKINDSVTTAESMVKIVGWATAIYSMVSTMLPQ